MADLDTSASAPAAHPGTAAPRARSPIAPAEPVTIVDGWEVSAIRAEDAGLNLTDCNPLATAAASFRQREPKTELKPVRFGRAARDEDGALVVGSGPGECLL